MALLVSVAAEGREMNVGGKVLKEGMELDTEQEGALPDTSDPANMKMMKCGVCQAAVMEMAYGINRQVIEVGRKLREVEVIEILDKICATNMDKYGLLLDANGQPTAKWSNDDRSLRAKGGWVTRMALDTCSDVYNEHEEYLVEMAPKSCSDDVQKGTRTCSTRELVIEVCAKGFKWCTIEPEADAQVKPEL